MILLCFVSATGFTLPREAASTTRDEFWPELDFYLRLNEQSRLFFQYSGTREDNLRTYADGLVGGFLDLYALPLLQKRIGVSAPVAPAPTPAA